MGYPKFDISEPALPASFPARIEQRSKASAQILTLVLLGPAGIAIVMPLLMVAAHIAADPHAWLILADRPLAAALLILAFAVWALLFAWPLLRATERLLSRRTISIGGDRVTVGDRTLLGTEHWSLPIASYHGIAHRIRTGVSGARHELILVHASRNRNVALAIADRFDRADLERVARLLQLPELQSEESYRPQAVTSQPALHTYATEAA